jgi:hypothetical protein
MSGLTSSLPKPYSCWLTYNADWMDMGDLHPVTLTGWSFYCRFFCGRWKMSSTPSLDKYSSSCYNNVHLALHPPSTNPHKAFNMQANKNATIKKIPMTGQELSLPFSQMSLTTTQPQTPFPLMRLPGELRNQIYREYFNTASSTQDTWTRSDHLDALQPCLPILHANSQLRSEAASIFYQEYVSEPNSSKPHLLSYSDEIAQEWEITGLSNEARMRRLALFCQSMAEHEATDVNIALKLEGKASEAIPPHYVEVLSNFMVCCLCGGQQESQVLVSSNWQRIKAEVLSLAVGTAPTTDESKGFLILTRTFQDYAFEMNYYYDRTTDREYLTLVGPLAKIDWSRFAKFPFAGPMGVMELRGEVTTWFAEGSESKYSSEKMMMDSWQEPGLMDWWTSVPGPPRRARLWSTVVHAQQSVYSRPDGRPEMDEKFVMTGPHRRNSFHGYESRILLGSRSRKRSLSCPCW